MSTTERRSREWMRHASSHVLRITRSHVSLPMRGVYDTLKQLQHEPPTPSEWGASLCPNGRRRWELCCDGWPTGGSHRTGRSAALDERRLVLRKLR